MSEKIMTRHPDKGKQGVNISRAKYEVVRRAIEQALRAQPEMTFSELTQAVARRLKGKFDGSIPWYVVTVKLDLEARRIVQPVPKTTPQRLRLKAG